VEFPDFPLSASIVFDREHPAIVAELERLAETFQPDRQWVNGSPYRLSDRVWQAGQETRAQIDAMVRHALVTGEDAIELARKLEAFLSPELQPVRNAAGRLVRDSERNQRRAIVSGAPGRGGRGSFRARSLARTEISRAMAEATEQAAALNPFVRGLRWTLSGRHPRSDPCDQNARRDTGLGPGIYRPGDTPMMPQHPMCLCHWEFVVTEDTDAVVDRLRRDFRLDEL